MSQSPLSQQVLTNFSLKAGSYNDHALVQSLAAQRLAAHLRIAGSDLVAGPFLEIGCGTGSLSLPLIADFPNRQIIVSDISPEMLKQCEQTITQAFGTIPNKVTLTVLDGEKIDWSEAFALICSSFTLQWLSNLDSALACLLTSLKPGGKLIFAVPSDQSFPEWRKLCEEANVPFTANAMPAANFFRVHANKYPYEYSLSEESITQTYRSFLDFLRDVKGAGASTSLAGNQLKANELLNLVNYADRKYANHFEITYSIIFGQIQKS